MTNFKWPNEPLISFCRLAPPTVIPVLENGAMIYSVVEVKDSTAPLTYLLPSHIHLVSTTTQTYPEFCYLPLSPHLALVHATVISQLDHLIQASPCFPCFCAFHFWFLPHTKAKVTFLKHKSDHFILMLKTHQWLAFPSISHKCGLCKWIASRKASKLWDQ